MNRCCIPLPLKCHLTLASASAYLNPLTWLVQEQSALDTHATWQRKQQALRAKDPDSARATGGSSTDSTSSGSEQRSLTSKTGSLNSGEMPVFRLPGVLIRLPTAVGIVSFSPLFLSKEQLTRTWVSTPLHAPFESAGERGKIHCISSSYLGLIYVRPPLGSVPQYMPKLSVTSLARLCLFVARCNGRSLATGVCCWPCCMGIIMYASICGIEFCERFGHCLSRVLLGLFYAAAVPCTKGQKKSWRPCRQDDWPKQPALSRTQELPCSS